MPESQNIEYKQSWRYEYLKWISGFAEGGVLVIGRDDTGQVVGVKDAKKLLEDIPNKVRDILGIIVEVTKHGYTPAQTSQENAKKEPCRNVCHWLYKNVQ